MTQAFQIGDTVRVDLWNKFTNQFEPRTAVITRVYVDTYDQQMCTVHPVDESTFTRVLPEFTYEDVNPNYSQPLLCNTDNVTLIHESPWRKFPADDKMVPMVGDRLGVRDVRVHDVEWMCAHVWVNGARYVKSTVPKSNFTTF